jgi:hypothetical protein
MIIAFDVLEEFNKTLGALPLTVDQKTALKGTDFYRKV